jgi:hypothetical protein
MNSSENFTKSRQPNTPTKMGLKREANSISTWCRYFQTENYDASNLYFVQPSRSRLVFFYFFLLFIEYIYAGTMDNRLGSARDARPSPKHTAQPFQQTRAACAFCERQLLISSAYMVRWADGLAPVHYAKPGFRRAPDFGHLAKKNVCQALGKY